jgi:hypothetical protein
MDESIRRQVNDLLIKRDFETLVVLCEKDRRAWQEVRYSLYSLDERISWAAIEATAKLMEKWWKSGKEEKVKNHIRTLFWSMTDESGGIGWSAPQTVAEIIATIPEIIDPYGSMLIAHTIDEPPLINGCLWGIGRMGRLIAGSIDFFQGRLLAAFQIDDAETLGLASRAMGGAGFYPAIPYLKKISARTEPVRIYVTGDFLVKPLSGWVEEALSKLIITY